MKALRLYLFYILILFSSKFIGLNQPPVRSDLKIMPEGANEKNQITFENFLKLTEFSISNNNNQVYYIEKGIVSFVNYGLFEFAINGKSISNDIKDLAKKKKGDKIIFENFIIKESKASKPVKPGKSTFYIVEK